MSASRSDASFVDETALRLATLLRGAPSPSPSLASGGVRGGRRLLVRPRLGVRERDQGLLQLRAERQRLRALAPSAASPRRRGSTDSRAALLRRRRAPPGFRFRRLRLQARGRRGEARALGAELGAKLRLGRAKPPLRLATLGGGRGEPRVARVSVLARPGQRRRELGGARASGFHNRSCARRARRRLAARAARTAASAAAAISAPSSSGLCMTFRDSETISFFSTTATRPLRRAVPGRAHPSPPRAGASHEVAFRHAPRRLERLVLLLQPRERDAPLESGRGSLALHRTQRRGRLRELGLGRGELLAQSRVVERRVRRGLGVRDVDGCFADAAEELRLRLCVRDGDASFDGRGGR